WQEFFQEPTEAQNWETEIRKRIRSFLTQAYRRTISEEILDRYVRYAVAKTRGGMPFVATMKKVASAVLSSPLFLYRYQSQNQDEDLFELASNLSYFLWSSGPDRELMALADQGELSKPEVLNQTLERMFADPKIERFLDTFPAQWMQLENVLAATPDPGKHRFFSLDKSHPASLHMLIEPLLLFDAIFVEDRPVLELIAPGFGYQSEFLKTWYTSDLKPPRIDTKKIVEQNRLNDRNRQEVNQKIEKTNAELAQLINPVRERILSEKQKTKGSRPVELKPLAAWEFDGNLKSSIGDLDLKSHGKVTFKEGRVVLNQSYLLSKPIPVDLKAKTLEVWCLPHNLNQAGGGLMGIQGQGDFFDTIVIGERQAKHWISGSNGFSRTLDFAGSVPETKVNEMIHLVMVYRADGTTLLYRNGLPYGQPFKKQRAVFPKKKSKVIFGLRHLPAGNNKYLHVSLDKARLYDRALTREEVLAAHSGNDLFVSAEELAKALSKEEKAKQDSLGQQLASLNHQLKAIPANQDPRRAQQDSRNRFDNKIRSQLRSGIFNRIQSIDPRYGGVITNAAVMSMTSGPKRTHPISRGAWLIEVILNDPPPPPPNDVPPLNEESGDKNLTIREKFKIHRENPDCAGCHSRLDPLGFAMENFDVTGRWRDQYENGREVDPSGTLWKQFAFNGAVDLKKVIATEKQRFLRAFTKHLLRFALARELEATDALVVDSILAKSEKDNFRLKSLIQAIVSSKIFHPSR
ncbi:MAG: DUF1588 domain-containing protein, partial [Planctomycetota bacterium]|nr:DUF1588 domain-containing protein [Planctomycetota bacterium]